MKLHYLGIIKNESKPGHELCAAKDLSTYSRFTRNNYAEFMTMFSKLVAERTKPGDRKDVEEQGLTFHAYGHTEGIAAILISEHNYPSRVAHELLSIVINEFLTKHPRSSWANSNPTISFPELEKYLVKYQDLNAVDRIKNVQDELDGVKATLYQTMDTLLERGEKLDDMVTKSEVLSAQSKMFYTQAKKQNSCCVVM